jgi:CDGSH-type Zn-finger protein
MVADHGSPVPGAYEGDIMINTQNLPRRHEEQIPTGKRVKFCRCWQSATFPYCDDAHKQINAETGDVLGPVVVTGVAAVEDQAPSE